MTRSFIICCSYCVTLTHPDFQQFMMAANCHINIICEGYLQKESKHVKTMRRRWIMLKSNAKLYSYKTRPSANQSSNPTEIIDLSSGVMAGGILGPASIHRFSLIFKGKKQRNFAAAAAFGAMFQSRKVQIMKL